MPGENASFREAIYQWTISTYRSDQKIPAENQTNLPNTILSDADQCEMPRK